MTSLALAPTGAAFGEFDVPTTWKSAQTGIGAEWVTTRLRHVENSSVRDALDMFDSALNATSSFLLFVAERQVSRTVEVIVDRDDVSLDWLIEAAAASTGFDIGIVASEVGLEPVKLDAPLESLEQQPAVAVIQHLVDLLGMPKRDVLRAAGISKSTFHTWDKPQGPRPRVGSQGQLWALAEAVDLIAEHLGEPRMVGPWILADNRRRSLLRERRFDQLVNLAAPAAVADPVPYVRDLYAAGEEKLEPRASTAAKARPRRATTTSTTSRTSVARRTR